MQHKFTVKKIKVDKSVGDLLTQARFDLELSIEKISQKINISEEYLMALENGDYFKLPGEVYTRNWLKKYAQFLGLAVDKMMKLYDQERGLQQVMFNQFKKIPKFKIDIHWTPQLMRNLALALVVVLVLGYILVSAVEADQTPKLAITNLIQDEIQTAEEKIQIIGQTEKNILVFVNDQPVRADSDGNFTCNLNLSLGTNLIQASVVSDNGKHNQIFKKIIRLD
ncbi:MAG: helix-turn-helix domain-containing protein [Patescibacteria group bacterium]|jgi:cytoskeletal protein RodZ|nr:helix-turn-helix domain-containing protein [Patescibacteria group bacterium]